MTNDSARLLSGVVYGGGSEQLDEKNHKLHRCFSSCINFFGGLIKVIEDAFLLGTVWMAAKVGKISFQPFQ